MDDVIKAAPLFRALDDGAADALRQSMTEVRLRRGRVVFREGDTGDQLFVLAEGRLKVGVRAADGRESLLSVLGPGDMFGELSVFDPGRRAATATAMSDVRVLALRHDALRPWLDRRPEVAVSLLQQLSGRLRRANAALGDLVFSDVAGRVARALLDLSDRFGAQGADGLRVRHGLTQGELAQLVGASRETVNKALADFAGRGWLRRESRGVVLLDVERLRRRAR